jgi:peptide/nickel transport system substrate-binding protein
MKNHFRFARLAFVAAAAGTLALGALPAAEARPFRVALTGDANTMDPHTQNAGNVTIVIRQIYEPLVKRGK